MAKFTGKQVAAVAARLGKSTRTIHRWVADGCNILSDASLTEYQQLAATRAKGKAINQTSPQAPEPADSGDLGELPPPGRGRALSRP